MVAYSKWYVRVYVYVTRHRPINSGRYATGQKRCQMCEMFIKWDGLLVSLLWMQIKDRTQTIQIQGKIKCEWITEVKTTA